MLGILLNGRALTWHAQGLAITNNTVINNLEPTSLYS
jgi:hypothetical protein